ncbi:MAG: hypothetical protein P4M15_13545 [Alphaproteobacteria bacterium]|nr:hypothetical protein [Alphaproteobacteria bacterium]
MREREKYICPVCGYPGLSEPAYNDYGNPSFDICVSFWYQFGKTDDDEHFTHEQWRQKWIAEGAPWRGKSKKAPSDWNPMEQLRNIGVRPH